MNNDSILEDFNYEVEANGVDIDELEKAAEKKPFPYLMFMLAWIKDSLDAASFGLLSLITTPFFFLTFLLWFWGRGFLIRKLLWKRFFRRLLTTTVVKALPLINMAPVTMLLVFVVHNQENKIVQVMEGLLRGEYDQRDAVFNRINQIAYASR